MIELIRKPSWKEYKLRNTDSQALFVWCFIWTLYRSFHGRRTMGSIVSRRPSVAQFLQRKLRGPVHRRRLQGAPRVGAPLGRPLPPSTAFRPLFLEDDAETRRVHLVDAGDRVRLAAVQPDVEQRCREADDAGDFRHVPRDFGGRGRRDEEGDRLSSVPQGWRDTFFGAGVPGQVAVVGEAATRPRASLLACWEPLRLGKSL